MAYWLGKMNLEEKDFSDFFIKRKNLLDFYLNDMKPRIVVRLSFNELREFEKAVAKKYEKFSALNSRKSVEEALKDWVNKTLNI